MPMRIITKYIHRVFFLIPFMPALAFCGPGSPPAGAPILNQSYPQKGAVFNVSSGTVFGQFTIGGALIDGTFSAGTTQQILTSNGPGMPTQWRTAISTDGSTLTLNDLADVTTVGETVNYALLFNGTMWVAAPQGTSFAFSIASFSDGFSSPIEEGVGIWKSSGAINFTASYSNGPPIGSTITFSGWSALPLSSPFTSTTSIANVNYPSVGGSVVFTLTSQKTTPVTSSITHNFYNDRYDGVSNVITGHFVSTDVTSGVGGAELSNSIPKTFTVNPGAGQYIVWASATRLGTVSFTCGGFLGGFDAPQTLTVTNGSGYSENYYVYSSHNANLGSTTCTTSTP